MGAEQPLTPQNYLIPTSLPNRKVDTLSRFSYQSCAKMTWGLKKGGGKNADLISELS